MIVAAPGRVSTTTVWPQVSVIFWPITRAMMSVEPPGANGTMILIGLSGYLSAVCAAASVGRPATHSAPNNAAQTNAPALCFTRSSPAVLLFPDAQFGPGISARQPAIWQIDCFELGN